MTTNKIILTRMMNDAVFTDAVFANAEKALAEYELSPDELERFKQISKADFEALANASPESRKSMAVGNFFNGRMLSADDLRDEQN